MRLDSSSCYPSPGRAVAPTLFQRIVAIVAAESGLAPHMLVAPSRGRAPVAAARQRAMYLCHVAAGRTLTEVGRFFGRDRTTVAHACRLVEDMRDEPDYDALLDTLEHAVLAAPGEDR